MDNSIPDGEMWQVLFVLAFTLIMMLVVVVPFWFISSKAGYSKWLSLLMLFPITNLIFLYFLAFSNWPSLKKDQADRV